MNKIMILLGGLNGGFANLHFSSNSFRGDLPYGQIMTLPGGFNGGWQSHISVALANPFVETPPWQNYDPSWRLEWGSQFLILVASPFVERPHGQNYIPSGSFNASSPPEHPARAPLRTFLASCRKG